MSSPDKEKSDDALKGFFAFCEKDRHAQRKDRASRAYNKTAF